MTPRYKFVVSLACAVAILCSVVTTALAQRKRPAPRRATQTKKQSPAQPKREPELRLEPLPEEPSVTAADVAITARVKARELTFEVVPNVSVEFPGQPARATAWEAERENLPTPVQPGVTYRNIGIRLKITSVFSDIDRIVAEALGEVPVTDEAKITPPEETKKPSVLTNAVSPSSQAAPPRPRKERH